MWNGELRIVEALLIQEFFELRIRILQYLDRGAAVFGFQRGP